MFTAFSARAQEPADTANVLREVEVQGYGRRIARVGADGAVRIDAPQLVGAARNFGEADMLRLLRQQGGVSAPSDYASGLSIDGMDVSQTGCTLNGVPVQFPYHFGGIFSVFSAWQYPALTMRRNARRPGAPAVLGGMVELEGRRGKPERLTGEASAGLMAASISLEGPVGGRVAVGASARVSYADALLGLVEKGETQIKYGFGDVDLDARYMLAGGSVLRLFGHYNSDHLDYDDDNYALGTFLRWDNALAGLALDGDKWTGRIYYTAMSARLAIAMQGLWLSVPSAVRQAGADGEYRSSVGAIDLSVGGRADIFVITPQSASSFTNGAPNTQPRRPVHAALSDINANAGLSLSAALRLEVGIEANSYFGPKKFRQTDIDPRVSLRIAMQAGHLTLHVGRYHQYIHQVGFSDIGMASNFKLASSRSCRPQEAINMSAAWQSPLPWLGLSLSADVYGKRVRHQPEYEGGLFDLIGAEYVAESHVVTCSGYNYGGSIGLGRTFSALSASANYSYARALRRRPGGGGWFNASSEIRHSLNVSASYALPGNRWTINAAFAYASGRPVTPIRALYFIGQHLMVEYGRRNSAHLPAVHRLDLGAAYCFSMWRLRHTVSLSLINAYGHRNPEMVKYTFDRDAGTLNRRYVASLYRFMPSVSYSIKL